MTPAEQDIVRCEGVRDYIRGAQFDPSRCQEWRCGWFYADMGRPTNTPSRYPYPKADQHARD